MNEAEVWKLQGSLSRIADTVQRGEVYYQMALAEGKSEYDARVTEWQALSQMWSRELDAASRVRIQRRMDEIEEIIKQLPEGDAI